MSVDTVTSPLLHRDGAVVRTTLDPLDLGIARAVPDDLVGGDPQHNAGVARDLLAGRTGPVRDVVLLNADSGRMGFPSEIVDDPLLSLVSPEEEAFQNAEERRVMYVAMTRARHTLTILASNARPSSFVTELRKDPAYGISTAPGAEPEAHVCGECGGRWGAVGV